MIQYLLTFLSISSYFLLIYSNSDSNNADSCIRPMVLMSLEDGFYSLFMENTTDRDPDASATFIGICDLKTLQSWIPCPFDGQSGRSDRCCPGSCQVHRTLYNFKSIVSQPQCNCNGGLENRQLQPIPDFPTCFLGGNCLNAKCTLTSRSTRTYPSMINNCILHNAKHGEIRRSLRCIFSEGNDHVKRGEITSLQGAEQFGTTCINKLARGCKSAGRRLGDPCCSPGQKCKRRTFGPKYMNELRFERESNNALTRILRAVSKKRHSRSARHSRLSRRDETVQDDDDDDDEEFGEDNSAEDIAIEEDENDEKPEVVTDNLERDEMRQQQREEMLKLHNFTNDDTEELSTEHEQTKTTHKKEHHIKSSGSHRLLDISIINCSLSLQLLMLTRHMYIF